MRVSIVSAAVGAKLARLRQERHLTQGALAVQLAVSPVEIAAWEAGMTMPGSTLWDLSRALDVTVYDLLAGAES